MINSDGAATWTDVARWRHRHFTENVDAGDRQHVIARIGCRIHGIQIRIQGSAGHPAALACRGYEQHVGGVDRILDKLLL